LKLLRSVTVKPSPNPRNAGEMATIAAAVTLSKGRQSYEDRVVDEWLLRVARTGRPHKNAIVPIRLSTIEAPVQLRSPGVMVPVQASAGSATTEWTASSGRKTPSTTENGNLPARCRAVAADTDGVHALFRPSLSRQRRGYQHAGARRIYDRSPAAGRAAIPIVRAIERPSISHDASSPTLNN
jgi:hypothetical protein